MNNKNLKRLTSNEARENGKIGGIKSGEIRREKRKLKEELLFLLDCKIDNVTIREKICVALIQKALNGDIKAFEVIRDTIGEKPTNKTDINSGIRIQRIFIDEETKKLADKHINTGINWY